MPLVLTAHPRLLAGPENFARATRRSRHAPLRAAWDRVVLMADDWLSCPPIPFHDMGHNSLLIRARGMQSRVVTLLVRWRQTGDDRYRAAALEHIRQMGEWQYWSWIARGEGKTEPDAIFDLSYGENCATLALAWDWLHDTLSDDERAEFMAQVETRALKSYRRHTLPESRAWWFGNPTSNWNAVCNGGAGMLIMAMAEELPDAEELLARVELSVASFFASLKELDGGWPEGIGYWNYGMRYGFMYLLSWARAHGKAHPLMRARHVRQTLAFPQILCPNRVSCSFGDVNSWNPMPFHLVAAERCGQAALLPALDDGLLRELPPWNGAISWPDAADLLLYHPEEALATAKTAAAAKETTIDGKTSPGSPFTHQVRGLDWMVLADRQVNPKLYLSLRGGTTEVPHGHIDLLSFHCVVRDESMITNIGPVDYLDSTFSNRRFELPETNATLKNGLFLNGVGMKKPFTVKSRAVNMPGAVGYRLDASGGLDVSYHHERVTPTYRLVLLLGADAFLIVDRLTPELPGRVEARFHTVGDVTLDATDPARAQFSGKRHALNIHVASNDSTCLETAQPLQIQPGRRITVLRHMTVKRTMDVVFAQLLTPVANKKSGAATELRVEIAKGLVRIVGKVGRRAFDLSLNAELLPKR